MRRDDVNVENSRIIDLPKDVLGEIAKSCSLLGLFRTSKNKRFLSYLPSEYQRTSRLILELADLGEWDEVKLIGKACPDLLTFRGTVYHPNPVEIAPDINPGRYKYVNCTAWQIACMNSEFGIAREIGKEMSNEEKEKQFDEIFPDGQFVNYNWNFKEANNRLLTLFDAVINDDAITENKYEVMNAATKTAWDALMNLVRPAPKHCMGLVFDARLYVEALKLYEVRYNDFETSGQKSFWCVRVEEALAYLMGMNYVRAHTHSFRSYEIPRWFVVFEPEPALVPSGCQLVDGSSYFLFRRPADSIPGYHIHVSAYGGMPCKEYHFDVWLNREYGGGHPSRWRYYEKMIAKITKQGEELRADIYKQAPKNSY